MTKAIKITYSKSPYLTEGKTYEVHDEVCSHMVVIDDDGDEYMVWGEGDSYVDYEVVEEKQSPNISFGKKDLVAGKHIVKLADGSVGLVVDMEDELWVMFEDDNSMTLRDQEEDLSYSEESYFDIVEVYKVSSCFISKIFNLDYHELVWKKNPKKKMTLKEIEEALGYSVEIVGHV